MSALAVGSFTRMADFADAVRRARAAGRPIEGRWTPQPPEDPIGGQDRAEEPRFGIASIGAVAGICTAALFYLLEWWTAVFAFPFNSGGRALNSWPAFLVAPVELGALGAGAAGFVAFLVRGRLTRLNDPAFAIEAVERASRDRFVLALGCEPGADADAALRVLRQAGAVETALVVP